MLQMICEYGMYGHMAAGALVAMLGVDSMLPMPLWAGSAAAGYASDSYCRGMRTDQTAMMAALGGTLGGMAFRRVIGPALM